MPRRNHSDDEGDRYFGSHRTANHYRGDRYRDDRTRDRKHDDNRRKVRAPSESSESSIEMTSVQPQHRSHEVYKPSKNEQRIPTKVKRSCTDPLFLILILLVMLLWAAVAFTALSNFNPSKIVLAKDNDGNMCGKDDLIDKPYLYIFDPLKCIIDGMKIDFTCPGSKKICVSECPKEYVDCDREPKEFSETLCDKGHGESRRVVMPTRRVLSICVPNLNCLKDTTDYEQICNKLGYLSTAFDVLWDIVDTYPVIVGGLGVALLLAFLWMLLMRFFAGIVIWISLLSLVVLSGGVAAYTGYRAFNAYKKSSSANIDTTQFTNLDYVQDRWPLWAGAFVVSTLVFLVLFLVLTFLRKRVRIAVALIKQASRSMASLPTIVIFPFFTYLLQIGGLFLLFSLTFIVYSLGKVDFEVAKRSCTNNLDVIQNGTATDGFCTVLVQFLQYDVGVYIFNLFSCVWFILFVKAFGYFVVAHAVAKYFWTHKEEGTQCMAVGSSVGIGLLYHLGTLAFGSLILTICGIIRMFIEYLRRKATSARTGSCLRDILSKCSCCFWILEMFLKYVNKNAYIMVAMYGKNFCRSAGKAFKLIVNDALRALVLTKVSFFIIFIAKVASIVATAAATYFVLQNDSVREYLKISDPKYIFAPVGVVAVGSYVLTSGFFNVYANAVDTLFLCFLEDKKINDGSREKPYRMSSDLLQILNKKNYRKRQH